MNLKNQVTVITGGSQGFGKALARAFSREGARVVIASENRELLESAANELGVDSFVTDVTSLDDVAKLAAYVVGKYGTIDVWVNNAGIQIAPSVIEEVDPTKLQKLFAVNFFGYFNGCQAVLPSMKIQNSGTIININSSAGLAGKPGISAYSASKFAVKGLTESLREEVKETGIKIYGIFPGGMQTEIYKEKYPADFEEYMSVDYAIEKVMENLNKSQSEADLIIRRPVSKV